LGTRAADAANVLDYGASPFASGSVNSTAFNAAMSSGKSTVIIPPGAYTVYNVVIPNGVCVFAYGAYFSDAAGANYVFELTGYSPRLFGAYIQNATYSTQAAIVASDAIYAYVTDLVVQNAVNGILLQNVSSSYGCSKNIFGNINIGTYSGYGLKLTSGCTQNDFSNCTFDAGQQAVSGGYTPKTGTYGVVFDASASQSLAYGGNQFSNCVVLNTQIGWHFYYATLNQFVNCIADGCSGPAWNFPNVASFIDMANCFAGACSSAISATGSAVQTIKIVGLRSVSVGQIPSGGAPTFYTAAGYSSPYYDIVQSGGAFVDIDINSWQSFGPNSHTFSESNVGNIQLVGGVLLPFNSNGTIAAGTTTYIGINGQSTTEGNEWLTPASYYTVCNAARVIILSNSAPGSGQTYSYSVRVNGVSSGITGTTSGASSNQATMSGAPVSVGPLYSVDIQVTTSASAAPAVHRGYILLLPQPS
jgi:hypothetical protein